MMSIRYSILCLLGLIACSVGVDARAEEAEATLEIRDHLFFPETLKIPAGQKVRLLIINHDATAEEFESYQLNREKVIPGHSRTVMFIGPLTPGEYPFFGEFYPRTAQGRVLVR